MKKTMALFLVIAMLTAMLASCGGEQISETTGSPSDTTTVSTPEQTTTAQTTTSETSTAETTTEDTTTAETTTEALIKTETLEDYEKDLVLHLDFDAWDGTKVTDLSGKGNDAEARGAVSKTESHDGSNAAKFGANGDYFVVKNNDSLNFTEKESFTISLWYCFDENTSFNKWPCVLNKGLTDDSKDCYAVLISSSSSAKGINFSASAQPIKGAVNINASNDVTLHQWHHFVAVQDAEKGTISTYVDGKRGGYVAFPANVTTPTDLFIGAMGEKVGQRQFLGMLDDIQIYNCALPESLIQGFAVESEKALFEMDFANEPNGVLGAGKTVTVSDADPDGFCSGEGFTLSVKFKREANAGAGIIVKKDAGAGTYGFSLDEQNRLIMHVGTRNFYADAAINNEWHHAVMIQNPDSKTLLYYLDGVLQGSTKPINMGVSSTAQDLLGEGVITIGDAQNNVLIDDAALYNYAVSEAEILAGYKTPDAMGREIFVYEDETTGERIRLPYRVYLPSDYNEDDAKQYPIMFFLHGHGEAGIDNTQNVRVTGGTNQLFVDLIARDDIIIVAPQATCDDGNDREWFDSDHGWKNGSRAALPEKATLSLRAAMALLDAYVASDKVDDQRVYAGGISMGGFGTWELITRKSDMIAAAIPLCGAGIPSEAAKLTDVAIWAFHGTADSTVPSKGTSDMEAAIKAAGGTKMQATYLSGVGHSCWDHAYATPGLIDWLYSQSK